MDFTAAEKRKADAERPEWVNLPTVGGAIQLCYRPEAYAVKRDRYTRHVKRRERCRASDELDARFYTEIATYAFFETHVVGWRGQYRDGQEMAWNQENWNYAARFELFQADLLFVFDEFRDQATKMEGEDLGNSPRSSHGAGAGAPSPPRSETTKAVSPIAAAGS